MAHLDSVKRNMLRKAVEHNVALVEGRRLLARRPRRRFPHVALACLALAIPSFIAVAVAARRPIAGNRVLTPAARAGRLMPSTDGFLPPPTSVDTRPIDPTLFPLTLRTVVIDAGHGGDNEGARAQFGLSEKALTLDIARRLRRVLSARGYSVVMTRDDDWSLTLRRRTEVANEANGDVFVSIHLNWIEAQHMGGVETYYLGPAHDAAIERRVAEENRDSGYRIGNLKLLLDQLYADARRHESAQLARMVQGALLRTLRSVNPQLEDRGIKTAPFVVLMTSAMPAILAEVSSLSNSEEATLLRSDAYRDRIAGALAEGIDGYARGRDRVSRADSRDR